MFRGAALTSPCWLLSETVEAIAVVKPEKQAQEEERHHEQEKDQYGSQKIIHGKTSFVAATQPRAHAAHRPISPPPGPIRENETARLTPSRPVGPTSYVGHFRMTIKICVRKTTVLSGIDRGSTYEILRAIFVSNGVSAECRRSLKSARRRFAGSELEHSLALRRMHDVDVFNCITAAKRDIALA